MAFKIKKWTILNNLLSQRCQTVLIDNLDLTTYI